MEEFTETETQYGPTSEDAFSLINNVDTISSSGRKLLVHRNINPHLFVFDYPDFTKYSDQLFTGIKYYSSHDGNYLIEKYSDNTYKIFNFHRFNQMSEFEGGFPNYIDQSQILDFEFMSNILLVFTQDFNEPVFGITIKENLTRIDNPPSETSEYVVNTSNFVLLGARDLEGVKLTLNLTFGSMQTPIEDINNEGDINVI